MAKTIYKWTLSVTDRQSIDMPASAQILTVQMQHGRPQLWALLDPSEPKSPREIAIIGTGNPAPDQDGKYVGTFQLDGGALIFHVFEREN